MKTNKITGKNRYEAKYLKIARTLEQRIRTLQCPAGAKLATEAEIQRRFGVSSITAKHALNRLRAMGLIERRQGLGSIVVARPLQAVRPPKAEFRVGLIWSARPQTRGGMEMLCVIEEQLAKAGYSLMFRASHEDPAREKQCLEWFEAHGIKRVLLTPSGDRHTAAVYEGFRKHGMRLVCMDRGVDSPHYSLVGFDNKAIGRLAGQELKQAGCRRIAVVTTGRHDTSIDDRLAGVVDECRKHSLAVQIFPITIKDCGELAEQPLSKLDWWRRIYAETGPGAGWFGVNETIAVALLRLMVHEGIKVPADAAVLGVGNMETDPLATLFLSGIVLDFRKNGEEAAKCVVTDKTQWIQIPPSGVVRRSSTTVGAEVRWNADLEIGEFQPNGELAGNLATVF
ncbi:MAG: LacI family DNA-binding transcriptional regulator [Candidatus Omnitrophota bacterium]